LHHFLDIDFDISENWCKSGGLMITVANKLKEIAVGSNDPRHADVFGRSAFNRYYYASYLVTREMLRQLNSDWSRSPHSSIPSLLESTIIKQIRGNLKKQKAGRLVSEGEASQMRTSARDSATGLANILRAAYRVRCVADYEPEEKIRLSGKTMELDNHSLDEAQGWPKRASFHAKEIIRVWKKLGL
jgi:hypothetical protein